METEYVEHKRSTSEMREGMESVASILNKHASSVKQSPQWGDCSEKAA